MGLGFERGLSQKRKVLTAEDTAGAAQIWNEAMSI